MDINNEFWVVWTGIASILHTWPKNQWFPSPLAEGSMSLPLSLSGYANSYCGFQGPCCVAAMIWSKIVFLLTLTLLPSITNVEPKRDYEHCHEILYCTWLLLQMLVILPSYSHFWIEKIKNKYYCVNYFKTISSIHTSCLL